MKYNGAKNFSQGFAKKTRPTWIGDNRGVVGLRQF